MQDDGIAYEKREENADEGDECACIQPATRGTEDEGLGDARTCRGSWAPSGHFGLVEGVVVFGLVGVPEVDRGAEGGGCAVGRGVVLFVGGGERDIGWVELGVGGGAGVGGDGGGAPEGRGVLVLDVCAMR